MEKKIPNLKNLNVYINFCYKTMNFLNNKLTIKIGIFVCMVSNSLIAKDFCEINIIEKYDYDILNCSDSQPFFGYVKFASKKNNFSYVEDSRYKIEIISEYYSEIINMIKKLCYINKKIRVKDVTNYNEEKNEFSTTIILSCIYKRK